MSTAQTQEALDSALWARGAGYEVDQQAVDELRGLLGLPPEGQEAAVAVLSDDFIFEQQADTFAQDFYGEAWPEVQAAWAEQDAAIASFLADPQPWMDPEGYWAQVLDEQPQPDADNDWTHALA